MKLPALFLIVVAATLCLSSASPQEQASQTKKEIEASTKKIAEIRAERIAVLKQVVDASFRLAKSSRVEISDTLEARTNLLQAELDVAEKPSDRVALYKQAWESLKEYEELAIVIKANARGTELSVLKIKARRLEIEMFLEQAKIVEANARH
jgi:septal ring factor EnvC (AmiA/AmiB activator)